MSDEVETGKTPKRGNAGKGRPKGAANKMTRVAKEVIAAAAEELGGVEALVLWAKEDATTRRIFWSVIYPKLLPLKVNNEVEVGKRLAATWLPPQ